MSILIVQKTNAQFLYTFQKLIGNNCWSRVGDLRPALRVTSAERRYLRLRGKGLRDLYLVTKSLIVDSYVDG